MVHFMFINLLSSDVDPMWEQGSCSGESSRFPPIRPEFDTHTRRHKWAEFAGSLLYSERIFSGNSGFPLSSEINI